MLEKGATFTPGDANSAPPPAAFVDAPPAPIRLLARLAGLPGRVGLLSLAPPDPGLPWRSFVGALPLETSSSIVPDGGTDALADRSRPDLWGDVPRWVGLLPYEAARASLERPRWTPSEGRPEPHHTSPVWARYGAMLVVDHRAGTVFVVGDDAQAVRALRRAVERGGDPACEARLRPLPVEPEARHGERVAAALELIRAGDIYQVNLARRLEVAVTGDALGALRRLTAGAPSQWAALIELPGQPAVVSTSPELFLQASRDGRVETWPIKGTRRRGHDAADDERQRRALAADPKERAELSMVIDLERNDLGKLAVVGSVRVPDEPRIVTHRTLHHRVARVAARLPAGVSWADLVAATWPSGSVTGAPKVRAMEVIASLEPHRRGLYTGAFGCVRRDGALTLAMAIRTLTVREGLGHYHVGGGIVADSDPGREVDETRVKALQLSSVWG